jgi:hypothetical protein
MSSRASKRLGKQPDEAMPSSRRQAAEHAPTAHKILERRLRLSANPAALPPHDPVRAPWGQATAPAARALDCCASACALSCCATACALGFASTATAFVDMIVWHDEPS